MRLATVAVIMAFIAVSLQAYKLVIRSSEDTRSRLTHMAQYSYETGCYQEAMRVCNSIDMLDDRNKCLQDAFDHCPIAAKAFSDWVDQVRR